MRSATGLAACLLGLTCLACTGDIVGGQPGSPSYREVGDEGCAGAIEDCVVVTRWVGEGEPGTFEAYLDDFRERQRPGSLASFVPATVPEESGGALAAAHAGDGRLVLLLVNGTIAGPLGDRIARYAADLRAEGYAVVQETVGLAGGTSPAAIKDHLRLFWGDGLHGVVLVGEFPAAWYRNEVDFFGEPAEFPIDLFYMDLDGTWTTDGAGRYVGHTGAVAPEIFVARIDAHNLPAQGAEVALLAGYFDRDHAYRLGVSAFPDSALAYQDDDWADPFFSSALGAVYSQVTRVTAPAETTSDDYLAKLASGVPPSTGSTFVQVMAHSYPQGHYFAPSGWIGVADMVASPRRAHFYNLFACSNARYTEENHFGGLYAFGGEGLGAVGSTKTGSMLRFEDYYAPLGDGLTFGEAYLSWWQLIAADGIDEGERNWYYGMTYLGDPLLRARPSGHAFLVPAPAAVSMMVDPTKDWTQTVVVTLTGGASGAWTAAVGEGASWMSVSPASGTSGDRFTVTIHTAGLPLGERAGEILLRAADVANPEVIVPVRVNVVEKVYSVYVPIVGA